MLQKSVKITIQPDGASSIEAVNFTGKSCKDATKPYEQALGIVTSDTNKPEFFKAEVAADRTVGPRP